MDKVITLPAGNDKLVIKAAPNDWCPVFVVTPLQEWLLGKDNWNVIVKKLFKWLSKFDETKDEPQCILAVMDPHGAAFIQKEGDHYKVPFQGKDKPRVFYSMKLSKTEKQQWLDILEKEVKLLPPSKGARV